MIPLKLTLRGFKGIKSGLNKDQITIDFSSLPEGRIAIAGPNGKGKSTILQNMHPYLLMPDRVKKYTPNSFSYYDECFLPDSRKELIWQLEDTVYKSLVEINPAKRKTKAYLYVLNKNNEWEPLPETRDGNVSAYNKIIEKILMNPQLFFVSVFSSQEARKLVTYTRAEMMDVFTELLQLNQLEEYKENSHFVSSLLTQKRKTLIQQLEEYKKQIQNEPELAKEKEKVLAEQQQKEKELANIKSSLEKEELLLKELIAKESAEKEQIKRKETISKEIQNKQNQIKEIEQTIRDKRQFYRERWISLNNRRKELLNLIKKASSVEPLNQKLQQLQTQYEDLKARIQKLDKEQSKLNSILEDLNKKEKSLKEKEDKLNKLKNKREKEITQLQTELSNKQNLASLLDTVPCKNTEFASRCKFVKNAVLAQKEIPELQNRIKKLQNPSPEENKLLQEINQIKAEVNHDKKEQTLKQINSLLTQRSSLVNQQNKLEKEINQLKEELKILTRVESAKEEITHLDKNIKSLTEEGKKLLNNLEKQKKNLQKEIQNLQKELTSIKVDTSISQTRQKQEEKVNKIKELQKNLEKEITDLKVKHGQIEESIKNVNLLKQKIKDLENEIENLEKEISEWNTVNKLYKELIPLEIEDAGPEISEIANQLLYECYGPRFSITINTQEMARSKKKELKDTFDIIVYDSERDEKKSLRFMSGGEKVWIEEAIMRAISLYNCFRSNRKIETLFTDEKDGALDEDNKIRYLKMKEKVLQLGGFKREYFISHSPVAQEMSNFVLNIEELA